MRFLLDEAVPVQLLEPLRLNRGHDFDHVIGVGWAGKPDRFLFRDAANRKYDGLVTLDVNQLANKDEWRSLRDSDLHHISVRLGSRASGVAGTARVIASLVAAMPYVLDDLSAATGQRIVEVALLSAARRHESFDPTRERQRYPYWR